MSNGRPHISVVTPVYGNQLDLQGLYNRLVASVSKITTEFEIIMVNDASPDNSWEFIKKLSATDPRVRGINLSRNFGQHRAITAGLQYVRGDWTVVMDCDLQDRPEEIPNFYEKAKEGYDVVVGRRYNRKDTFIKKQASQMFYRIFNYLTDQNLDNRIANFGIYSSKVIDSVKMYKEKDRSFGLLVALVGFKRTEIDVVHDPRAVGKTSYSFTKSLELAIGHIVSHTNKPLRLFIKLGFIISALTFLFTAWLIFRYFAWQVTVEGWTSVMVFMALFMGLMMMMVGVVGLYIGNIYDEIKNRPLFIISATTFDTGSSVTLRESDLDKIEIY